MKKKSIKKNKEVKFNKNSLSNSPLSNWLGIIVYVLILLAVLTFLYNDFLKSNNAKIEDELINEVNPKYEDMQKLISEIPGLDQELINLKAEMDKYFTTYYGDVPQEKYINVLKNLRDKTEIKFTEVEFKEELFKPPKPEGEVGSGEAASEEVGLALDEEKSKQIYKMQGLDVSEGAEIPIVKVDMDIVRTEAKLKIEGSFKDFMKFYYSVESSKPSINIEKLDITKASTLKSGSLGYGELLDLSQLTQIEGRNNILTGNSVNPATLELVKKADDKVQVELVISFYKVPSISKYVDKEELYSLDLKASMVNPFKFYDFFAQSIKKETIFSFDADYKTTFANVAPEDQTNFQVTKNSDENGSYTQLEFSFGKNTNNPRILIDFLSSGVVINEPINKIGLDLYNAFPNNNMIYIVVRDAAGSDKTLQVSDSSPFIGEASLTASVPKTLTYPLTLRGIYIVQNGSGDKLDKGSYKLRSIYKGTNIKDEQNPKAEEPQPITN